MISSNSVQSTSKFDYKGLDKETQSVVAQRTTEVKTIMRRSALDIIYIGQKLTEVKQCLKHGNFINWLGSEFCWSLSTATKFMQVGEQFKSVKFTDLNCSSSALYLLAAPSVPQSAREETLKLATSGEKITYTKAKAIISQHKKKSKFENSESSISNSLKGGAEVDLLEQSESQVSEDYNLAYMNEETHTISAVEKNTGKMTKKIQTSIRSRDEITNDLNENEIATDQVVTFIRKLTPEQLASVIRKSASEGLSLRHLKSIIAAANQVLEQQDQTYVS